MQKNYSYLSQNQVILIRVRIAIEGFRKWRLQQTRALTLRQVDVAVSV